MTVRQLAAALADLPEKYQDRDVFSTADWKDVTEVIEDSDLFSDREIVEIA